MSTQPSAPPSAHASLTPFVLEPILVERIWGVHSLAPWHADPPEGKAIGEIWLTAETCRVESGNAPGDTLAAVAREEPDALGDPGRHGFPLLMKLLFPREKLSVQVHPDDRQAQAMGMPRGKTECWYVLSAEPGATVAVGFREPIRASGVKQAIEDGSLEDKLRMFPVKAGDMIFVDAGTVHAIGPGMVVLETQQYSDTTYRLWDYGRPRELHIEAGTAVTRTETAAGPVAPRLMEGGWTRLVTCDYFAVDRFDLKAEGGSDLGETGQLQILIALSEGCALLGNTTTSLPKGKAVIVPRTANALRLQSSTAGQVIRVLQP